MYEKSGNIKALMKISESNIQDIETKVYNQLIPELLDLLEDRMNLIRWKVQEIHVKPIIASVPRQNQVGESETVVKIEIDLHFVENFPLKII
ncbi:MAG: hypothetical protein ACFFCQ_16980 [Promethearchaeota archaeon]